MKKEFFHKNSLKSSDAFTTRELAFETLRYLIDLSKIRSEEDIRKIKESSAFLSEFVTEHDIEVLVGLIAPFRSSVLTVDDLAKLGQEQYRQVIEKELLEKARKAAEIQLEKDRKKTIEEMQIEQKRLEELRATAEQKLEEVRKMESMLDSLPSSINPEDYVNPEEEKQPQTAGTWWQRTGLTADPFPTKLGLNQIPHEKYEKVIVATKIFREYVRVVQETPKSLFGKTILITGQFGSGKTTLLQYMSYKLVPLKISPFFIVLDPISDPDIIRQNFYSEVFNAICKGMRQAGLGDPRAQGSVPDRSTIADLLSFLAKQSHIDGFVVMIDGLHKAESTLEASLEFVKQLQNFHEYLSNCGANVCFLVTGSPLWLRRLQQNPAYSGSFYRIDEVPRLTFDDAYELLRRRIEAFASPGVPIFLDRGVIKFAYDCLSADVGDGVTFRAFIDYILPKLESGDFKSVGISVQVDLENARRIHQELAKSPIADRYSYFLERTKDKSRLKRACYLVLRSIYRNSYRTEQDAEFLANRGAFYVLKEAQLIHKTKAAIGLGWAFSTEFLTTLEDLNEQGYPPPIVFQALSMEPTEPTERGPSLDPLLDSAQGFVAKWESEWPEIIPYVKEFLDGHKGIVEKAGVVDTDLAGECRDALLKLVQCAQIILNNKQLPEEWLSSTWLDVPNREVVRTVLQPELVSGISNIEWYQKYYQSASAILETLEQLLEINRMVNIASLKSWNEEMKAVYAAGNYLHNGDFEKALEEINSRIEKRLRVAFHLAFSLHFGSDYLKHLPKSAQDRISSVSSKGPIPVQRSVDQNLFYHLSRSEYAEVVNDNNNWNGFLLEVFRPKTKEEVVDSLRLSFSLDDRKQHRDRIEYFRNVREQIRQVVSNSGWLLNSLANVPRLSIKPNGYSDELAEDGHTVKVSYIGQDRCASSHPWKIDVKKEREITSRLLKADTTVNLSDDAVVSTLYNSMFAELFIVIAGLLKKELLEVQDQPESGMYLRIIPKGPTQQSVAL